MLTRRMFDEVLADLDELEPLQFAANLTDDFTFTMPGVELHGPAAYYDLCADWAKAFPDLRHHVESFVADGDDYGAEIRISGTHLREFRSGATVLAATGRPFSFRTATLGRFTGNLMASRRVYFDTAELSRQLDADLS